VTVMVYDPDDFFSLDVERQRILSRPPESSAPPWLFVYDVDVDNDPWIYANRFRGILADVIDLAATQPFDGDYLPVDRFPAWFVEVGSQDRTSGSGEAEFAFRGRRRYMADQQDDSWDLQDWLHRFDPDAEIRSWRWWDITQISEQRVRLWVDNGGEEFIASQDLRWLAFVCGAAIVHEPFLEQPLVWAKEPTTGLPLKSDTER
jgi:hypothetical protein